MNRRVPLVIGEYYHIYNRGVEKRDIFWDELDRKRFIELLYLCNGTKVVDMRKLKAENISGEKVFNFDRGEPLVAIGAYCLMPNHFHLLVREISEGGVSLFMKKLLTAYAMYINKRHDRTGVLFQGRFRSEHVNTDNYLHYLHSYIHLNPIKMIDADWKENGVQQLSVAMEYLNQYSFSSYTDFLGKKRPEVAILNREQFPDFFQSTENFEAFHQYWLTFKTN